MDRKLIWITSALLVLQVSLLLADWPPLTTGDSTKTIVPATPIGYVLETKQTVKRRARNAVVWEDSGAAETLLSYDSLLTLENSSAELNLQGDVHLSIHENTLVVLEPPPPDNPNLLRIRFAHGQFLAQNKSRPLELEAKSWNIEAQSGSDISLKSLDGDKVEVEIHHGHVELKEPGKTQAQVIDNDTRFQISSDGEVSTPTPLSKSVTLNHPATVRVYTHNSTEDFKLGWSGAAVALRQVTANSPPLESAVHENDSSETVNLPLGAHYLSLKTADGKYTREVVVDVVPAPAIRYTSPLPRDRFAQNSDVQYSWTPLAEATSYRLELSAAKETTGATLDQFESHEPFLQAKTGLEGPVYMRVYGVDRDGFEIPPSYALPIYFVRDPLAPPQLIKPQLELLPRAPAGRHDHSMLERLWQLFFEPDAVADEHADRIVDFNWQPVEGADFYNIEISSTPDFSKPEVMAKVEKEKFGWSGYELKTYYWRVAAGVNSGRMGLFSEVGKIDLSGVGWAPDGQIAPGVSVHEVKKVAAIPVAVAAAPAPTPTPSSAATVSAVLAPTAVPSTPVALTPTPEPTLSPEFAKDGRARNFKGWRISPRAEYDFHYISFNAEGFDFTASEQGFTNASASLWMLGERDDGLSYLGQLRLSFVKWAPTSDATYPFQTSWTETYYALRIWREFVDEDWGWGGWTENTVRLKRSALEVLSPDTVWQAGPTFSYHTKMLSDALSVHTSAGLLFGGNIVTLGSANVIDYTFLNRKYHPYVGADVDLKLYFGSGSYSGDDLEAGFHVGIHF